jgi:hypothetical protein
METVRFWDSENKRVIDIPYPELAPGAIQRPGPDGEENVWMLPAELERSSKPAPFRHDPFPPHVKDVMAALSDIFAEHYPRTPEEWENGFRVERDAEREVLMWMHAATTYQKFTRNELLPHRRADVFRIIMTCMNVEQADMVWSVLELGNLKQREAAKIVDFYFAGPPDPSTED